MSDEVKVGDRVRILGVRDDAFRVYIGAVGTVTILAGSRIAAMVGNHVVHNIEEWEILPAEGSMEAIQEAEVFGGQVTAAQVRADNGMQEDWKAKYEELEGIHRDFRKKVVTVGRREAVNSGWCPQFERVMEELGLEDEKTDYKVTVTMDVVVSMAERGSDIGSNEVLAAIREKLARESYSAFAWEIQYED